MVHAYQSPTFRSTSPMLNTNQQQNYYATPYNGSINSYNSTHRGIYTTTGRQIGYTTNYGNNFGTRTRSTSLFNHPYNRDAYVPANTYGYGPKRSKERPFSGNVLEDFQDWLRMNGIFGVGYDANWPGYVDGDYWEQFIEDYPEYRDYAENWFRDQGQNPPWLPDDPFPTPIGDCMVPFLTLLLAYVSFKATKLKKT